MSSYAYTTIVGNLGDAPKGYTKGKDVEGVRLSVAVNTNWHDKQTGEKKSKVDWFTVFARGKLAKVCSEYLVKGSKVFVQGTPSTKTEKVGDKYFTQTIINARTIRFLDPKEEDANAVDQSTPAHIAAVEAPEDDIPYEDGDAMVA